MCGILVTASIRGRSPSASTADVTRMRDRLLTRGPDDEGLWSDGQVHIGHRRLAINRPTDNRQPLVLADTHRGDGPMVLAFNGELYECAGLRRELERRGCRVRTGSDTELLAHAIAEWGPDAPRHVRGMFAFVAWRPRTQTLLMARDALGVIPLVYAIHGHEITIASEVRALLDHPAIAVEPDWHTVLHYLHSLKTTQGERTLFAGVHTMRPGEVISVALDGDAPVPHASIWWSAPREELGMNEDEAAALVREVVERSIEEHLVSDVPLCTLLSGGLDSTIVTAVARRLHPSLQTFCAGAVPEDDGDCAVARRAAAELGTNHHTVGVRREDFLERWPAMVATLGMPLATPNEVAIHAVAEAIRPHAKVTLSGEGADELFAGYGPALDESSRWIERAQAGDQTSVEEWYATTFAWVPPSMFDALLAPEWTGAAGSPSIIARTLHADFASCGDPRLLRTHLDLQRRQNLPSLLHRLNTATMLASVEGRTPFADRRVAEVAARIPMHLHAPPEALPHSSSGGNAAVAVRTLPRTKRVLRAAFADILPEEPLLRPKASFPLPFERWLADAGEILDRPAASALLRPEAIAFLRGRCAEHWRIAWPTMNIALWLERWWGE